MINPKLVVVTLLILIGIGVQIIGAEAQEQANTKTYKDADVGISFQYPSHWTVDNSSTSIEEPILLIKISENSPTGNDLIVTAKFLDKLNPPVTTLKDFAKYQYENDETLMMVGAPNVINDNQTTVAGGIPGLQMEYVYQLGGTHGLDVWTINDRGVGYEFSYQMNEEEFAVNIPAIREMLSSIEFTPLSPPQEEPPVREPSFME